MRWYYIDTWRKNRDGTWMACDSRMLYGTAQDADSVYWQLRLCDFTRQFYWNGRAWVLDWQGSPVR
jgi:hypothetical protein